MITITIRHCILFKNGNGACGRARNAGRLKRLTLNALLLLTSLAIVGIALVGISRGFFGWPRTQNARPPVKRGGPQLSISIIIGGFILIIILEIILELVVNFSGSISVT